MAVSSRSVIAMSVTRKTCAKASLVLGIYTAIGPSNFSSSGICVTSSIVYCWFMKFITFPVMSVYSNLPVMHRSPSLFT